MDFGAILTTLISGGVGGNIAGALLKKFNLGPLGNSIAGIVGGLAAGPAVVDMINPMTTAGTVFSNIAGSGVGGAIVMVLAGLVKNWMDKRKSASTSTTFNKDTTQTYNNPSQNKSKDYQEGPRP